MQRRTFIKSTAAAGFVLSAIPGFANFLEGDVPVRAITKGPKFHWFGYYDKQQVDASGRYVLGAEVDFEGRSPTAEDKLKIGMIDLQGGDKWTELGKTKAWNWQQGCMLQWLPGTESTIIWNDREGDHFVSRTLDIKTGKKRTYDQPIYSISPDGKWAIAPDFARLDNMRPGYGYAGVKDKNEQDRTPKDAGIRRLNLETGESKLIIPFSEVAAIANPGGVDVHDNWHWFNHLLFNPDGSRFIFLNRWRKEMGTREFRAGGGSWSSFITRMFTADIDGKNLSNVDPCGFTSHFIWRDPNSICAWSKCDGTKEAFYLIEDKTGKFEKVGESVMTVNGHNTYLPLPGAEWILNDTYADPDTRKQKLYLYHVATGKEIVLGKFFEAETYKGEYRCDLHPKSNRNATQVIFDSTHGGNGRQMYIADISKIVKK